MIKNLFYFVLLIVITVSFAFSETIEEAIEEKIKLAETNRLEVKVYAVTIKAIIAGRLDSIMSPEIIKTAKDVSSIAIIGYKGSNINIYGYGNSVVFTVDAACHWKFYDEMSGFRLFSDPIANQFKYARGAAEKGVLFYKNTVGNKVIIKTIIPNITALYSTNMKFTQMMAEYNLKPIWASSGENARGLEKIIIERGENGILTRERVSLWYADTVSKIEKIIKEVKVQKGYLVPDGRGGFILKDKKINIKGRALK